METEASVQALKNRRILRRQNWKEGVGGGRREAVEEELPWRAEAGSQDQTAGREAAPGDGPEEAAGREPQRYWRERGSGGTESGGTGEEVACRSARVVCGW